MSRIRRIAGLAKSRRGASKVEYGLLAGLLAVGAIGAVSQAGDSVTCLLEDSAAQIANASGTSHQSACGGDASATPAGIVGVTGPADGDYAPGQDLGFQVQYDAPVVVDGGSATPTIPLDVGGTVVDAVYAGGSGSDTLSFSYPIAAGMGDADGIGLAGSGIAEPGEPLESESGGDAETAFALDMGGVTVAETPYVASVSTTMADGTYYAGDPISFDVVWSEAITIAGSDDVWLEIEIDGQTYWLRCVCGPLRSGGSGTGMTFTGTVPGDVSGPITIGDSIRVDGGTTVVSAGDGDGANLWVPGGSTGINTSGAPVITGIGGGGSGGSYVEGDTIDYTVNWSGPVSVDTSGGTPYIVLDLDSGPVRAYYSSGSGTGTHTYTYTVGGVVSHGGAVTTNGDVYLNGCTMTGDYCVCEVHPAADNGNSDAPIIDGPDTTLPDADIDSSTVEFWEVGEIAGVEASVVAINGDDAIYFAGGSGNDAVVVKVLPDNSVAWTYQVAAQSGGDVIFTEIAATSDGGVTVMGTDADDAFALRLNSSGVPQYENNWTGGDFQAVGAAASFGGGVAYHAVRDDAAGATTLVARQDDGTGAGLMVPDFQGDVYALSDGFLLHDTLRTLPGGGTNAATSGTITKVDTAGAVQWSKTFSPGIMWVEAEQMAGGDVLVVGASIDGAGLHGAAVRIDSAGNIVWFRESGTEFTLFTSGHELSDGRIVLHAKVGNTASGDHDAIITLNGDGSVAGGTQQARTYPADMQVLASLVTSDSDVVVTGTIRNGSGFVWGNTGDGCTSLCSNLGTMTFTMRDANTSGVTNHTPPIGSTPQTGTVITGTVPGSGSVFSGASQPSLDSSVKQVN